MTFNLNRSTAPSLLLLLRYVLVVRPQCSRRELPTAQLKMLRQGRIQF